MERRTGERTFGSRDIRQSVVSITYDLHPVVPIVVLPIALAAAATANGLRVTRNLEDLAKGTLKVGTDSLSSEINQRIRRG